MQNSGQLLGYLQQGIDALLEQEGFDGGQEFRRTQKQALEAYKRYLNNENYTTAEKLKGFFEIPTGVGKTAIFVGIIAAAHKVAEQNGEELKTTIVVPTVQLLEQTVESLEKFAPQLKNSIGLYGDGNKNLSLPLTVMTYDAFVELSESGKIGSHNTDILISDEAHRGTSERRVLSIADAFNENTVQIAFTATAHFDEEKSVENSHKRQIFYKSVADAIREGELASYVSSQRYIIRVDPDEFMLTDEFQKSSDERRIAYRRAAKQNAWNQRMVKIFRDGHDTKTGDLLSDNQAGFFVEGIRQAGKLEGLLNGDATLVKRAKEMGYKGVAVAIHSGISKAEQKRRYKDYKAGKYMAVIGDEMFKEGFDHPPMKTLFDCPHSSVVDKAQILGRGLRKWWNELKGRYEGLTIIDTVMYFGDEDPDIQKTNRDRALMNTISVKQVLEGTHIDSEYYFKTEPQTGKISTSSGSLFNDDPDVEEYTSLEELYNLEEEIQGIHNSIWKNNPLTMADIKESIDAYRKENSKNPNKNTGEIKDGYLAGSTTWSGLSQTLQNKSHGLKNNTDYQNFIEIESNPSLSTYLVHLGYSKLPVRLTLKDIKNSIDAYRTANEQRNPLRDTSGPVLDGPLENKTTWLAISDSINMGRNHLSDDTDYQKFIETESNPSLSTYLVHLGYSKLPASLTLKDIKNSIDAYRTANEEHNPVKGSSGNIINGSLAGKTNWMAVDAAMSIGSNTLKENLDYQKWLKIEDRPSLYTYLVHLKYAKRKNIIDDLKLSDIKNSIKKYCEDNDGKIPSSSHQIEIKHGYLAGKTNWQALSTSLREGFNGLEDDRDYQKWIKEENKPSLFTFLAHLGHVEKREVKKITLSDVKDMIDDYRKNHEKKNPGQMSGKVEHGVMKGKSWSAVDAALKKSGTGLSEDKKYKKWINTEKKPSLYSYLVKLGYAKKVVRLTKLNLSDIWDSIVSYRDMNNGQYPSGNDKMKVKHGPLAGKTSWMALSGSVRSGGNGLKSDPRYQKWIKIESKPTLSKLCKKIETERQKNTSKPSKNNGPS